MIAEASTTTGELEPTATYCSRRWFWEPLTDERDPSLVGQLTIVLHYAKRNAVENDAYHVLTAEGNNDVRAFDLINTDGEQEEAYRVCVPRHPKAVASCTCQAAKYKLECKHTAAMVAVDRVGVLAQPEVPAVRSQARLVEDELPECFRGLRPSAVDGCPF